MFCAKHVNRYVTISVNFVVYNSFSIITLVNTPTQFNQMDLNKAMVELYKKKANSVSKPKRPPITSQEEPVEDDKIEPNNLDPQARKKAKLAKAIESLDYEPLVTFDQLYGCESAKNQVINIVNRFERAIAGQAKKSEWPVLICGSHGLGKTSMAEAAYNYAKVRFKLIFIPIQLKKLVEQSKNEFKLSLRLILARCSGGQPGILLIDDLDQLKDKEDLRLMLRNTIKQLLEPEFNILIFCTISSIVEDVSGIDFLMTIHLKRPPKEARFSILNTLRNNNKNLQHLTDENLESIAINTPSFTALDLKKMFDIAETESSDKPSTSNCYNAIELVKSSFKRGTHLIGERPTVTWADIGGLPEVRQAFSDIMKQIQRGDINCKFAGIALYGPPGCGKTMVAQAMANQGGFNFISIKPAELVDKFLGETEKNIRRVFSEAQEHEPCMIYFDEFDGLCGTRGNRDNITSAIQTLLSEMDGFANRGKSIILASTNRLEDIDPAMKRPGRLSKHIYVGPPDEKARTDILNVITRKPYLSISSNVDIDEWARRTEGFSGADLDFLVSEAESKALSNLDESQNHVTLEQSDFDFAINKIKTTNKELGKKLKNIPASLTSDMNTWFN